MIKTEELRLGNVLKQGVVNFIDKSYVRVTGKYNKPVGLLIEEIDPIHLTEEILLNCGFELNYKSEYTKTFDLSIPSDFEIKWNNTYGYFPRYKGEPFTHIKYLHQLQNLYFALTGQELQFNR